MGSGYDKWVHDPIVQKEPPRFFESDIAEVNTCISPLPRLPVAEIKDIYVCLIRGRRLGRTFAAHRIIVLQFKGYIEVYFGVICILVLSVH